MVKYLVYGTIILALACAGWIAASYWSFSRAIDAEIAALEATARPNEEIVTEARLAQLPVPVQRHLRQAGVVGQKIPSLVRIAQKGRMRSSPDSGWIDFEAAEIYSTNPPALVWRADFPSRAFPVLFGRDHYLDGDGRITMKMLGTFPVADSGGGVLNAAAQMRYLNEMMWFPAALAGRNLDWTPVDDNSADVTFADRGTSVSARLFFNAEGGLVNFSTERFDTNSNALQTWETPIGSYGSLAGMNLPIAGQGVWQYESGPFAYIELKVTGITLE